MIIAVKKTVKGVHEKVINYLKHKNSTVLSSPPFLEVSNGALKVHRSRKQ